MSGIGLVISEIAFERLKMLTKKTKTILQGDLVQVFNIAVI